MGNISAVIIAFNEARCISRCIVSLEGIVDEVIVVDSGSTDETSEIAQKLGARILSKEWEGYGANKNAGILLARNDWILSIDADEWMDGVLRRSIESVQLKDGTCYKMKRVHLLERLAIYRGAYKPEKKIRLFQKAVAQWNDREVHEELVFNHDTKHKILKGILWHELALSKGELEDREMNYACLSAQYWRRTGRHPGKIKRTLGGIYHFNRSYLGQLGILDGSRGWETSVLQMTKFNRKMKCYDHLRSSKNPD